MVTFPTEFEVVRNHIDTYEKIAEDKWLRRAQGVLDRYNDVRPGGQWGGGRYNILWSNIQTLLPASYANPPKPSITRRFKDDDELGLVASDVLERAVSFFVSNDNFNSSFRSVVLDRLLVGRGVCWQRYVPTFQNIEGEVLTDDADDDLPSEIKQYEEVVCDYVYFKDFGHNLARTWDEVTHVWRRVFLSPEKAKERFPESWQRLSYSYSNYGESPDKKTESIAQQNDDKFGYAVVYEVWCKPNKMVYWYTENMEEFIDVAEDPLRLKEFFPCPRPLFGIITNESLIPIPDYTQVQDQARELDNITRRITLITSAIKVIGLYDGSQEGIQRMLDENFENRLVKVDNWSMLAEKGGLEKTFALFPMEEVARTLLTLYDARERVKQDFYEISGMADIVRGASDPDETATAQKIKGQFATLRLKDTQEEIARYTRDCVAICAEIIATHFEMENIKKICNVKLLSEQERASLQQREMMRQQIAQMPPNPNLPPMPPLPPMTEEEEELLEKPTWEQIEKLFRDQAGLAFKIDIETDSTIRADMEADRQARIEFLEAVTTFLQQATQLNSPELMPLLGQMLMFGVRGFNVAKDIETAFEVAVKKLEKKAQQPPPPNPEMQKMQMEMQMKQAELQMKQAELQMKQQEMAAKAQLEVQRFQYDQQLEQGRMAAENQRENSKLVVNAQNEQQKMLMAARLERDVEMLRLAIEASKIEKEEGEDETKEDDSSAKLVEALAPLQEAIKEMTTNYLRPKRISTWRDDGGNLQGSLSPEARANA